MNYETKVSSADVGHPVEAGTGADLNLGAPDAHNARKRRLWVVIAVMIVGVVIGAFMLAGGEEEVPFAPQEDGTLPAVTVMVPGSGTLEGVINATGTLAARREMPVGVVGEGGRVVSVPVEAGQWVSAGQVLAVIDRSVQNQQASAQRAQVEVAQADANLAQANLDRAVQLVERGFISQADIDRLTATRDAAEARVAVARAQLGERQARNAQLNIVAPAAGLLLLRNVEPGQVVSPGSGTLFSIARGGEMEMLANLNETELATVPVGASVSVTPTGSDESFTGQVWQISPVIDAGNRQGTARVALPYDPALRPGGFATARIASGTVVAPRLPESAIMSDDTSSFVFIIDSEDKVVRRNVEIGMIRDDGIAIAGGLDGSERVVLFAAGFLTVGQTVKPVVQE